MHRYVVNVHKVVMDSTGHDRRVLQHQAIVHARSEVAALHKAKALFREAAGIADWRLRADTCERPSRWPVSPPEEARMIREIEEPERAAPGHRLPQLRRPDADCVRRSLPSTHGG